MWLFLNLSECKHVANSTIPNGRIIKLSRSLADLGLMGPGRGMGGLGLLVLDNKKNHKNKKKCKGKDKRKCKRN